MRVTPAVWAVALAAAVLGLASFAPAGAQEPVVHAVFFYSPTCPHCHEVASEVLPPLRQQYGDQLVIVGVDVTTQPGQALYQAAVAYFALPEWLLGVPTLVVGTDVMVGSVEIPQRFPRAIQWGLAGSGIDWPPVPEIRQALTAQGLLEDRPAAPPPRPGDTAPPMGLVPLTGAYSFPDTALRLERPAMARLFLRDPLGNAIAVTVLVFLLGALAWSVRAMMRPGATPIAASPSWLFPVLGLAGIGIAAYLSFVEVTGTEAVCGPIGDCNAVQQSSWARLFGFLPVGLLGLAGYAAMLVTWGVATGGPARLRGLAWTAAWAMAFGGTAFSAYLTFLEPFVIGATCAWCVSSAVAIALMLVVATPRAAKPDVS